MAAFQQRPECVSHSYFKKALGIPEVRVEDLKFLLASFKLKKEEETLEC